MYGILIAILTCIPLAPTGVFTPADGDFLTIIDGGRSNYEIVVRDGALPTTRLAVRELRMHLREGTGVRLPIVSTPTPGRDHIFIASTDKLKPHAFQIVVKGRDITLRGRDSFGDDRGVSTLEPIHRGSCNAVYEFLERFCGVRWFWGDALGDVVPAISRVRVPANFSITQVPAFEYRALPYGPPGASKGEWARHNRLGSDMSMSHGHALQRIVPVEEWAARGHPEYAAWVHNGRRTTRPRGASGGHVCTTNADVVKIVATAAKDLFVRHPRRTMFSISPPDGSGMCMDDLCRNLDVPGHTIPYGPRKGRPILTDRILTFYNRVASLVSPTFPDRYLGGYIYGDYLLPPARVKAIHPNVALFVAPNVATDMWNEQTWSFMEALYGTWGSLHDRVYAYDICSQSRRTYGLPAPFGDRIVDFVKLLRDSKFRGGYIYIGPTWESMGPDSYILAKLLWDPDVDVVKLRREYYGALYQQASGPVRAYFETAAECWKQASDGTDHGVDDITRFFRSSKAYARHSLASLVVGYTESLPMLESCVVEAERRVAGDDILEKRVRRLRDNLTLTIATIRGLNSVVAYESGFKKDRSHLRDLAAAIEMREKLLTRTKFGYAAELVKHLRFADQNIKSPLAFGGEYHRLATDP